MALWGDARTRLAVAGLAAICALAGGTFWHAFGRPEAVLGRSFATAMARLGDDWLPPSRRVVLDTIERAAIVPAIEPTSLPTVQPAPATLPLAAPAIGDFISVGTTGGKVSVLEVVDVRPVEGAPAAIAGKPGLPPLVMVICRDADHPDLPPVRLFMEAAPAAAPVPTRS